MMIVVPAGRSRIIRGIGWSGSLVLLVLSGSAAAQEVRDFNTDTPGKSYTPHTVAQGYWQLESDIFHITEVQGTRLIESFDPILKYGLTANVEVDVQTNGLLDLSYRVNGRELHLTGFGDTVPAIKWGVLGNDSQSFSAAVRAGIKIPTASSGLGDGAVEYFFSLPVVVALPLGLSIQAQQEIDILRNQNDAGKHLEYGETASVGRSFGKTSLSAELFAQSGTDPNSHALYTADAGITYAVTPVVALTFGTYVGLNRYAPGVEAYTAFGFRF